MTKPFQWLTQAPQAAQRTLLAASLGWLLDSFDVMLYALILPAVMLSLHLSKARAGLLGSFTLVSAAAGGILFGLFADRFGRTRALMLSVLLYAVFTAACGLAWSFASLALFRILLGFGMGGEWASGASLVSDTWPAEHRSKALGLMQSSWAIGYGLAALVAFVALPLIGWRGTFLLGILPAFATLWIRQSVHEPESWQQSRIQTRSQPAPSTFRSLFGAKLRPLTLALTLMNSFCLFAYWGFNLWVPSFLSLSAARGGIALPAGTMTTVIILMQIGTWFGYVTFGYLADAFGRKRVYVLYLLTAAALVLAFSTLRTPWALILLGPLTAFAATGYFTGFAAVTADVYEPRIRATAQGFTYNTGRLASAAAPFVVGSLADHQGFTPAFHLTSAAFLLAAACWLFIPETQQPTATHLAPDPLLPETGPR